MITHINEELIDMKSKPLFTLVISSALIVGLASWAYFHWSDETPPTPQVVNQGGPEKSTGHKWFDAIPIAPTQAKNDLAAFYDADGHIVDLDGLTISQYVKGLYDAANKGNKKAAFNIYSAETVCSKIPEFQREISSMAVDSPEKSRAPAIQSVIDASQAICADFNISSKERLDYLSIAAKGGGAQAQIAIGQEPPYGLNTTDPTDPRLVQWQKDGVSYLNQAAMQGDHLGLSMASALYQTGNELVPKDLQLALTYALAEQTLYYPDKNDPNIARLTGQLTPEQNAAAKAAAIQLVNSASSKP